MHCQACGALTAFRRRSCDSCGEPVSLRALIRQLFAADPSSAGDCSRSGRPPELASFRARVLAASLDITIMVVALSFVGALSHDPAFGRGGPPLRIVVFAWVAVLIHPVLLEGPGGQTIGKRLVGIRVVMQDTGGPIGYRTAAHRAAARALFWFVSFLALGDPLLRTLHDRSAGTVVIKDSPPPRTAPSPEWMEYETTDDT